MVTKNLAWQFENQGQEIQKWHANLKSVSLSDMMGDVHVSHAAVFIADMIVGFCKKGNLASPRIDAISKPIADFVWRLHCAGVDQFVLVQDWHDPRAKEFAAYGAHGVRDTEEAQTIPELLNLSLPHGYKLFRKNSLTPAFSYGLKEYLHRKDIRLAIVVGNCTDLCVRELAMYLRLWANDYQRDMRVVIPANYVETFDLPIEAAKTIGAKPHLRDVYQAWSLYEMSRNGIEVVEKVV